MKTGKFKVAVNFSTSVPVGVSDEDEHNYLQTLNGQIIAKTDDKTKECGIPIGKTRAFYLNLELRYKRKDNLFTCLDLSQNSVDYCMPLMDVGKDDFERKLYRLFDDNLYGSNVLVLDKLEIFPQHRGKRIGLAVLRATIEIFSHGCAMAVMRPMPLQFVDTNNEQPPKNDQYALHLFTVDKRTGLRRLMNYYGMLGFVRYGKTGLMVLNPCNEMPSLEKLGCPEDGYYKIEY